MELRVLTYFLTVAREKTISQAAEVLNLSQPTLSKQLKELEEELGVTLFNRGNRGITLTDEGIYLMNKGKEIVTMIDSTVSNISANKEISGEISIGSGETKSFDYVAKLLFQLRQKHSNIKVNLYSGNADDILEKVDNGIVDFGLVIDPVDKQTYDYIQLPLLDNWGLLVHSDHPLSNCESLTSTDLLNTPLLVSKQTAVDNQLADWLSFPIDSLDVVGTYNLLYNASLLVQRKVASALCIEGIIPTEMNQLVFVPLSPTLNATINIVWKKNQLFSKAAKEFLTLLKTN